MPLPAPRRVAVVALLPLFACSDRGLEVQMPSEVEEAITTEMGRLEGFDPSRGVDQRVVGHGCGANGENCSDFRYFSVARTGGPVGLRSTDVVRIATAVADVLGAQPPARAGSGPACRFTHEGGEVVLSRVAPADEGNRDRIAVTGLDPDETLIATYSPSD